MVAYHELGLAGGPGLAFFSHGRISWDLGIINAVEGSVSRKADGPWFDLGVETRIDPDGTATYTTNADQEFSALLKSLADLKTPPTKVHVFRTPLNFSVREGTSGSDQLTATARRDGVS